VLSFFSFVEFFMTTLYGLPLSHHQSHFARFVRAISLLIHGSINESSGTIDGGSQKSACREMADGRKYLIRFRFKRRSELAKTFANLCA
jgi:hypothetical protein